MLLKQEIDSTLCLSVVKGLKSRTWTRTLQGKDNVHIENNRNRTEEKRTSKVVGVYSMHSSEKLFIRCMLDGWLRFASRWSGNWSTDVGNTSQREKGFRQPTRICVTLSEVLEYRIVSFIELKLPLRSRCIYTYRNWHNSIK